MTMVVRRLWEAFRIWIYFEVEPVRFSSHLDMDCDKRKSLKDDPQYLTGGTRLSFFQWSCMDVRVGLWRKLSAEKLMLLNCGMEKTLESPLDCKEIQPVHPEGDQSWVFTGRTDAEAETPVLWPPHVKSWLIGKDPDAGRGWGQEEKGTTEDEMAGWHHWLDGHEFEWIPGVRDGQGGLVCCNSCGRKELDTTERLN